MRKGAKMADEKRLIDANSLVKDLELLAKYEEGSLQSTILGVTHTIKARPTIDAVEVRHGYWIPAMHIGDCCYRCSECQFLRDAYLLDIGNYCPNCGARMEGDVNG